MFIGREKELKHLQETIDREKSTIAVVYGRRRIGKSELIKKSLRKRPYLYFEGLENRPKRAQIEAFLFNLCNQTGKPLGSLKASSWKEAFTHLDNELKTQKAHIVLDEFQWMANYRSEIVADLKMVWELYLSKHEGITLVLCGSIASFMISKVIKSSALYGRTDLIIHLKGFLLPETNRILKNQGETETIQAQMMLGGVPMYLDLISDKASVHMGIEELGFTSSGYFTEEFQRIFISHFAKNPEYEKIVRVLAKHPYGLFRKEIAAKAAIDLGGGLTTHLKNLESAGFIMTASPFDKKENSRLLKFHLSDAYLRFYFEFIEPNLKKIQSGIHRNQFSRITQTGKYYAWMGRSFEYLCMEHVSRIAEILGFSGVEYVHGPYFRAPKRKGAGIQIDLLFDRKDNVMTLCEMKYSRSSIGIAIIEEVERKVELLQSGFPKKTIQRVLISQSAPTKDLLASAYFFRIIHPTEFF